jgi:hypothetical protein
LPTHIHFKYGDKELEIVKDFLYLGIKFSRLGSFRDGPFNVQEGGGSRVMLFVLALLRDRPFILQEGHGVMVFCFVQKIVFGQHES